MTAQNFFFFYLEFLQVRDSLTIVLEFILTKKSEPDDAIRSKLILVTKLERGSQRVTESRSNRKNKSITLDLTMRFLVEFSKSKYNKLVGEYWILQKINDNGHHTVAKWQRTN